jgi:hypothetical protein
MAYQRLQVSEGLAVIPSDTVPIPDPATKVLTGQADFTAPSALTEVGSSFTEAGIQKNAIVYNTTAQVAYFVTEITSDTVLALSPATTGGATDDYIIFNAPTKGATLYVGTGAGNIVVEMASERDSQATPTLTFYNVPDSAFLPLLVTKVGASTEVSNIIALW